MKHLKTFQTFLNEAKDSVTFSVNDDKLDQLLNDFHSRELDYVDIKGDQYYTLPRKDFDRFIDAADSKGFDVDYENSEDSVIYVMESSTLKMNEGFIAAADSKGFGEEDWSYYEESVNHVKEAKGESGLMVFGKTNLDNNKIGDWLDDSDYTAEWNAREGYWLFPEEEDGYDALEAELEKAFVKARINARFEGIF
jgi:hypothetical protein